MSKVFQQVVAYAQHIRKDKLENKFWIYVDKDLNVHLLNKLPSVYWEKGDILTVYDPKQYLREINKREPNSLDLIVFSFKSSEPLDKPLLGQNVDGYVSMNTLNKNIDNIYTLIDLKNKTFCNYITNDSNRVILGKGLTGTVFTIPNTKDVVIKEFIFNNDKDLFKRINNIIITKKAIHELFIAARFTQIFNGLPNGTFNKNFLHYDGFFICPFKNGYQGYIAMETIDKVFEQIYNAPLSLKFIKSIMFQLLFAIKTMQYVYRAVHNDLHYKNIMFKKSSFIKNKFLKYKFKKDSWYVENVDYIVKIGDLDLVSIFDNPNIILDEIYNGGHQHGGIMGNFLPGYDVLHVLSTFIHNMSKYLKNNNESPEIEVFLATLLNQVYDIMNIKYQNNIFDYFTSNIVDNVYGRPFTRYSKYDLTDLIYNKEFDEYARKDIDSFDMADIK